MKKQITIIAALLIFQVHLTFGQTGILDTSFDGDGIVTIPVGVFSLIGSVVIQPDGKIVVGGSASNPLLASAIARLNPDGSLDDSFGNGGVVTTSVAANSAYSALAIQPDGKLLAAGSGAFPHDGFDNSKAILVARYNSDGSLDMSFDTNGIAMTSIGITDGASSIAIQEDGKIVVAGGTYLPTGSGSFTLVRYHPNGSLDSSFSADGKTIVDFGASEGASCLTIQPDGKILTGGYSTSNIGTKFALSRHNPDGKIDSTFHHDGKVSTSFGHFIDAISAIVLQDDGKILVAGDSGDGINESFSLARYFSDGELDTSFGNGGLVMTSIGYSAGIGELVIQPDGKIVAAGVSYDPFISDTVPPSPAAVARYFPDGSLDPTFADGGIATVFIGLEAGASSVALQTDGKIVIGGYSYYNESAAQFAVARLLPNLSVGTIDLTATEQLAFVYPNPLKEQSVLSYKLEKETVLSIKIYDMVGRCVKTIVENEHRPPGENTDIIDSNNLAPGHYLLTLEGPMGGVSIKIVR